MQITALGYLSYLPRPGFAVSDPKRSLLNTMKDSQQSDVQSEHIDDDISNLLQKRDAILSRTVADFRKRLIRWVIRTVIGAALFGFLASRYSWGKYILYIWLPLAALSLLAIVLGRFIIERKCRQMQTLVESQLDSSSK